MGVTLSAALNTVAICTRIIIMVGPLAGNAVRMSFDRIDGDDGATSGLIYTGGRSAARADI